MSLKAGYARRNSNNKVVIDDTAIVDSMAGYIDDAMKDIYLTMKGTPLKDEGAEDRRILFVAIARGVLKYLEQHQDEFISTIRYDSSSTYHGINELDLGIEIESTSV